MNRTALKFCAALVAAATLSAARLAGAGDITTEWDSVKLPPKPELKSVTVDPKTTALLVLDLMKNNCGVRPRCVPIVPVVKKLIDDARGHNMMIVYNLTGASKPEDMVDTSVMPKPGDFMVKNGRGGDKFIDSNLDAGL
ncbi:MAG TPA: cysteine hydrolase, partial [Xanthobacteraceae bacterium]